MGGKAVNKDFDLKEGWQDRMMTWYGQGCTDDEVIANILIERGTFSRYIFGFWQASVPEFKDVLEKGKILQKAWWIKTGRENIQNNKFNTPLYIRLMLNLYKWRLSEAAKSETPELNTDNLTTEELETLERLMKKAQRQEEKENDDPDGGKLLKFNRAAENG